LSWNPFSPFLIMKSNPPVSRFLFPLGMAGGSFSPPRKTRRHDSVLTIFYVAPLPCPSAPRTVSFLRIPARRRTPPAEIPKSRLFLFFSCPCLVNASPDSVPPSHTFSIQFLRLGGPFCNCRGLLSFSNQSSRAVF